jgi:hypothetical protein
MFGYLAIILTRVGSTAPTRVKTKLACDSYNGRSVKSIVQSRRRTLTETAASRR